MEKITIKVQNAVASSGFVRLPTEDGKQSIYAMEGNFYEAQGIDASGNGYTLYWNLCENYDPANDDESDACDWENPTAIVTEDGKLLSSLVDLKF